ncbi:MAG: biopolymer transporter ExbD [Pseudomonadota bacterium]
MKLGSHRYREPEISLAPLIDVVFLLLIFFMVSTTFDKKTVVEVELPSAESEAQAEELPDKVEILVDAGGTFYVNEREVVSTDPFILKGAIKKVLKERTDLPVVIKADGRAPYQAVMTVMDVSSQLGLTRMTFVARRAEEPE